MGFNPGFNKASWVRLVVPEEKKERFASLEQKGRVEGWREEEDKVEMVWHWRQDEMEQISPFFS